MIGVRRHLSEGFTVPFVLRLGCLHGIRCWWGRGGIFFVESLAPASVSVSFLARPRRPPVLPPFLPPLVFAVRLRRPCVPG